MTTPRTARMSAQPIPRKARLTSLRMPVAISKASAEDPHSPRTFEAIAYSGGLIPGYTATPRFEHDYVIDLEGMTIARKVFVNLGHDRDHRVGHLSKVENTKRELKVEGVLSAATSYRDEVAQSASDGYPWDVSQETCLGKIRKLAAGKSETVNGQTFTGPLYIVGKSVHEALAFVPQGADDGNSVTMAATAAGENQMSKFDEWLVANDFDPENLSDKAKVKMQATFDAEQNGSAKTFSPPTKLSKLAEDERSENERVETITKMTHQAMKDHPQWITAIAEMGEKAIQGKTSPDTFELEVLRGTRHQVGMFKIHTRQEPDSRVMEAALCKAAGMPNYEKQFSEDVLEAVDRDPTLRNFSLQQMLIRAACANGYDAAPGERITTGNLKRVLRYAFPDDDGPGRHMRASGFSTVNLPGIFASAANKELLMGFTEEDNTWREISRIATSNDFKTITAYRLTDSLEYELLPPQGEIKHGTLSEESYTRTLQTYAKMLGLDRTAIINDDLSAFDDLRTRLGRGGARKLNNVFWAAFLNNSSFFTLARVNYIEGATTNLGTDGVGLTAAVAAFKKLLSSDGKRIGGTPTILLVPPELEHIADRLWTGGGGGLQTVPNTNPFAGKYRPVVVPWLSDSNFTGYSTTSFYLLRNPSNLAPMVVSFLNGMQQPTVESADADFNTLGIQFRGYFDFAANLAEYLSGVKSKGAA